MASKILRPYQKKLKEDILQEYAAGARNVLGVLPTGGGKTVVYSDLIAGHQGASCIIAHRQELVGQTSLTLSSYGVEHSIIAPNNVVRELVKLQLEEYGQSFYNPGSPCAVAGVKTLNSRKDSLRSWGQQVSQWVLDEGHHLLRSNEWGKALELFPNARGLAVTATPIRADGKGLGRHAEGLIDSMVVGPGLRELIDSGNLTDYKIWAPPSDLDLEGVNISAATGDYTAPGLKLAVQKSHIVGDVVDHYKRIAPGKLGITFATDIETATDISARFNAAGVVSEVLTSKSPDRVRAQVLRDFKARKILQIVNVDLFGEGFDLPALEVVSMARPTQSFSLFSQQFGRGLRILEGKDKAIIIDHVGNVVRHGLPDGARVWSLDNREKRSSRATDTIPVKVCPECTGVYERLHKICPYCGHYVEPAGRSAPEYVDGDLLELDAAALAQLRQAVAEIDMPADEAAVAKHWNRISPIAAARNKKLHRNKQDMQEALRTSIAWWAGYCKAQGLGLSETYRLFYFRFGIDIMSAQALGSREAEQLATKINYKIGAMAI